MDIRKHIKAKDIKEGRQEGWQKGRFGGGPSGRSAEGPKLPIEGKLPRFGGHLVSPQPGNLKKN